jgi:hypothetical protein
MCYEFGAKTHRLAPLPGRKTEGLDAASRQFAVKPLTASTYEVHTLMIPCGLLSSPLFNLVAVPALLPRFDRLVPV